MSRRWKLVSTAPLPAAIADRLLPEGTDGRVVVVAPRTEAAAVEAVGDADIVIGDFLFEIPLSSRVIDAMRRCQLIQQPSAGYHVPLVDATTGLLDDARLRLMKPTAHLVNVSRGGVVDERALVDGLRNGRLRGAALDVFEHEPLPAGDVLTELDNVILTPHSAGTVMEARIRLMELTAANVARVVRGEAPVDVVNGMDPTTAGSR